jgi:hypothetical protein
LIIEAVCERSSPEQTGIGVHHEQFTIAVNQRSSPQEFIRSSSSGKLDRSGLLQLGAD